MEMKKTAHAAEQVPLAFLISFDYLTKLIECNRFDVDVDVVADQKM